MSVVKWVFTDLTDASEYTFDINPNEGGTPAYKKNINYQSTAAPDGKTLIFEGRDQAGTATFSGVILYQEQYDALVLWFQKRHQIQVTDDLGRTFMIYVVSFEAKRQRAVHYPWKHSYTVEYVVVDWPS